MPPRKYGTNGQLVTGHGMLVPADSDSAAAATSHGIRNGPWAGMTVLGSTTAKVTITTAVDDAGEDVMYGSLTNIEYVAGFHYIDAANVAVAADSEAAVYLHYRV